MQQCPVVLSGGAFLYLLGSLGCLVLGVVSPIFLLDLEMGASLPSRLSFLLTCFVRGSPHHLVSVRPFVALFIKRGENLFRAAGASLVRDVPRRGLIDDDLRSE